jgi:hypothetical protein
MRREGEEEKEKGKGEEKDKKGDGEEKGKGEEKEKWEEREEYKNGVSNLSSGFENCSINPLAPQRNFTYRFQMQP